MDRASQRRGYLLLGSSVVAIFVVWLVILPRLERSEAVRKWSEPLDSAGINPSAMFYSEVYNAPVATPR